MYIITARRMTSGDLLKYRKGLFITAGYESLFPGSSRSRFTLTVPPAGILVDELTRRLETEVRLTFDAYPKDLAGPGRDVSKAGCQRRGRQRGASDIRAVTGRANMRTGHCLSSVYYAFESSANSS